MPASVDNRRHQQQFRFERSVATLVGVSVIAFVMALILQGKPLPSPEFYRWVRILISFAIGTLGATIPGFLSVQYTTRGFGLRAAGGLALFIITYFSGPSVLADLKPATIAVDRLQYMDLRTEEPPHVDEAARLSAGAIVSVTLRYRSRVEPSAVATVESERATLEIEGSPVPMQWKYFVTQNKENIGKWIGIDRDASPVSIPSGQTVSHDTAFADSKGILTWKQVLDTFDRPGGNAIRLVVISTIDGKDLETDCQPDLDVYQKKAAAFRQTSATPIMRITVPCLE